MASMQTREELGTQCRQQLVKAVLAASERGKECGAGKRGLILSGGVDTCAIAQAAAEAGVKFDLAITVVISEGLDQENSVHKGTDEPYATLIAKQHSLEHHIVRMTAMELVSAMLPFCVRVLETFDGMQLRNSMVVAAALHKAKELGCTQVLTGDAADELLGGYSFTWGSDDPEWSTKRAEMVAAWYFSGPDMGTALGVGSHSPYMEQDFVTWALQTTKNECIAEAGIEAQPGDEREQHKTGKLPLRHAYPEAISAWRRKDPIQKGSGSEALSDEEFWKRAASQLNAGARDLTAEGGLAELLSQTEAAGKVKLRGAEQLVYFREFQRQYPDAKLPSRERYGRDPCKYCGYQLKSSTELFCHTCGAYPAQDLKA